MTGPDWLAIYVVKRGLPEFGDQYVVQEQRVYTNRDATLPTGFVDRGMGVYVNTIPALVARQLDHARRYCESLGCVPMAADPSDDPFIVEVWL